MIIYWLFNESHNTCSTIAFCILFRFDFFFLIHFYRMRVRKGLTYKRLAYMLRGDDTFYLCIFMEFFMSIRMLIISLRFYWENYRLNAYRNSRNICIFSCRPGWKGPLCNDCTVYPGCKHGSCNGSAWQCICDTNWGGILCDQGMRFNPRMFIQLQLLLGYATVWIICAQSVKLRWSIFIQINIRIRKQ